MSCPLNIKAFQNHLCLSECLLNFLQKFCFWDIPSGPKFFLWPYCISFFLSHHISIALILYSSILIFFNFSLISFIYLFCNLTSFLPSPPPSTYPALSFCLFHQIHFSVSTQKMSGLPCIWTKHAIYISVLNTIHGYTDSLKLSCPYSVANTRQEIF